MKIKTIFLIAYFCTISVAFADNWGAGSVQTCGTNEIAGTEACIGESVNSGCASWTMKSRQYDDEFAILMMVAREINDHGARFCPTQVEGHNKNKGKAWTEYSDAASGSTASCVWLCQSGWTGDRCSVPATSSVSCDASLLKRENYSGVKRVASGANIKGSLPMFGTNAKGVAGILNASATLAACGVHKTQEHNMILAINRWLPSGHGAFVRKMVVRAERRGWKNMESTATVYPASNSADILVCKNGYQANANGSDCIEINANVCRLQQSCDGWTDYNEKLHTFVQQSNQNCYQFRCTETGKAFASETNRGTCVECVSGLRTGVSPTTGACVKCDVGLIFSANATSSGFCVATNSYSNVDLQYGRGRTKNSELDIDKQCWTMTDPVEYEKCVTTVPTTSGRN